MPRFCRSCYGPLPSVCHHCYDHIFIGDVFEVFRPQLLELRACVKDVVKTYDELHRKIDFLQKWDGELFEPPLADFCITKGDDTMPVMAHRNILASKSSVFRAMLTSGMKEQSTGVLEIKDEGCSAEGLREFVHFMYYAQVDKKCMESKWEELLALAVKYDVKELQVECEQYVATDLIPKLQRGAPTGTADGDGWATAGEEEFEQMCDNVVALYKVGNQYGLKAITEAVIRSMTGSRSRRGSGGVRTGGHSARVPSYHARFLSSQCYGALKEQNPAIALEICEFIASRAYYLRCPTDSDSEVDEEDLGRRLRDHYINDARTEEY